jgi:pyrophosphatase PpaX
MTLDLKAVLMDFDGVISDSFREGLRRIRTIAAIHDVQFLRETRSRLTNLWGLPGIELLERGLSVNRALAERMYADWEKMDLANPIQLIPGSRETLYWLRKNSFVRCLITSRRRENLTAILDKDDLIREFDSITMREDCPYHKPNPLVFEHAFTMLSSIGIGKEHCIFVGDTPSDILAGKSAGMRTLVVQTGPYLLEHVNQHPIALEDILQSIDDLPMWIEKHHTGALAVIPT